MRWSRALILPVLAVLIIACGAPATSEGGGGNGSEESDTPAASVDGGGGNGGGGSAEDAERVAADLVPPNSTETSRTVASGTVFATYESTDSIESLVSFYESEIPGTGMQIISTTNSQGGTSWLFAVDEQASFGGAVSVFPSGTGSGTAVSVQVSAAQ
jgi:hypothetical protein